MKEIKLTPTEKIEVYEKMLHLAENDLDDAIRNNHRLYGLCAFGLSALRDFSYDIETLYDKILIILPELLKYKPLDKDENGHWWSTSPEDGDNHIRIAVLEEIIRSLKQSLSFNDFDYDYKGRVFFNRTDVKTGLAVEIYVTTDLVNVAAKNIGLDTQNNDFVARVYPCYKSDVKDVFFSGESEDVRLWISNLGLKDRNGYPIKWF